MKGNHPILVPRPCGAGTEQSHHGLLEAPSTLQETPLPLPAGAPRPALPSSLPSCLGTRPSTAPEQAGWPMQLPAWRMFPWAGGAGLKGAPPASAEKGWSTMGETWGCLYWALIYSMPSLRPAPGSPTNSCFVQDLWHLQQADAFPTPVVNPGTKQRLCWPLASAQLCSARATKRLQGCWARPSLGHHPGQGRVDGIGVKCTIPALPISPKHKGMEPHCQE